jgi:NADH-quinone oxidoreductase subunit G
MVKIFIDDRPIEVQEGTTVFHAAKDAGIDIPHLCYHPALTPEGSCRMCLVEIEGAPKLELSCSTHVREGMKIFTQTEQVVEARKGVLEFLLAEHPPDCPICDKAGECKLQDYYEEYGLFESQFDEAKEKRQKKVEINNNLVLDQERCVLCTRCVRFLNEVTQSQELGVFERGIHSEVNIYDDTPIDNNYAGNLVELCPVGAITDKDFRFQTRKWFLDSGESICPLCGRGCNIHIESHKGFSRFPVPKRVYRIRARKNDRINKHWICDRGRYDYSYLNGNRLGEILSFNGNKNYSYEEAVSFIVKQLQKFEDKNKLSKAAVVFHTRLSNEEIYLIKKIFKDGLGMERIYVIDPQDGEADDLLLTEERTSNKRGAKEIGFDFSEPDLDALTEKTEFLLVFDTYLTDHFAPSEIHKAFDAIKSKVLFSAHEIGLSSQFDIVLPVSLTAEKSGTLTNVDGIIQAFSPVLETVGESRPEWEILVDIGKQLKKDDSSYQKFNDPTDIFLELKKEVSFFGKK